MQRITLDILYLHKYDLYNKTMLQIINNITIIYFESTFKYKLNMKYN